MPRAVTVSRGEEKRTWLVENESCTEKILSLAAHIGNKLARGFPTCNSISNNLQWDLKLKVAISGC